MFWLCSIVTSFWCWGRLNKRGQHEQGRCWRNLCFNRKPNSHATKFKLLPFDILAGLSPTHGTWQVSWLLVVNRATIPITEEKTPVWTTNQCWKNIGQPMLESMMLRLCVLACLRDEGINCLIRCQKHSHPSGSAVGTPGRHAMACYESFYVSEDIQATHHGFWFYNN